MLLVSFLHLPRFSLGGSYPPFLGGSGPSGSTTVGGTHHSFTSGYQIPVGGQSHAGGQPQFGGQTQVGAPPPFGGQPQVGAYNSQYGPNTSDLLAQLWNLRAQGNPQSSGGKPSQDNLFVPPNYGQPYLGSLNPAWGPNVQSSVPFQGNIPNQPNPMGYMPPILHVRIFQDFLLTCRLLMVLLVYRRDFLPKVTSILK
jgi:hypothetical protein